MSVWQLYRMPPQGSPICVAAVVAAAFAMVALLRQRSAAAAVSSTAALGRLWAGATESILGVPGVPGGAALILVPWANTDEARASVDSSCGILTEPV